MDDVAMGIVFSSRDDTVYDTDMEPVCRSSNVAIDPVDFGLASGIDMAVDGLAILLISGFEVCFALFVLPSPVVPV
jgi:hypothetical protein